MPSVSDSNCFGFAPTDSENWIFTNWIFGKSETLGIGDFLIITVATDVDTHDIDCPNKEICFQMRKTDQIYVQCEQTPSRHSTFKNHL